MYFGFVYFVVFSSFLFLPFPWLTWAEQSSSTMSNLRLDQLSWENENRKCSSSGAHRSKLLNILDPVGIDLPRARHWYRTRANGRLRDLNSHRKTTFSVLLYFQVTDVLPIYTFTFAWPIVRILPHTLLAGVRINLERMPKLARVTTRTEDLNKKCLQYKMLCKSFVGYFLPTI